MDTSTPMKSSRDSFMFDFGRASLNGSGMTDNSLELSPIPKTANVVAAASPELIVRRNSSAASGDQDVIVTESPLVIRATATSTPFKEDFVDDSVVSISSKSINKTRERSILSSVDSPIVKPKLTDATPNTKKAFENRAKRAGLFVEESNESRKSYPFSNKENIDPFTGSFSNYRDKTRIESSPESPQCIDLDSSIEEMPQLQKYSEKPKSRRKVILESDESDEEEVVLRGDLSDGSGSEAESESVGSRDSDVRSADEKSENDSFIVSDEESEGEIDIDESYEVPKKNRFSKKPVIETDESEKSVIDIDESFENPKKNYLASKPVVQISDDEDPGPSTNKKVASKNLNVTDDSVGSASNPITLSGSEEDEPPKPKYDFTPLELNSVKNMSRDTLETDLQRFKKMDVSKLPDGGLKIERRIALIEYRLETMKEVEVVEEKKSLRPPVDEVVMDQYLNQGKRMFGGAITNERYKVIGRVTEEALERIHAAITDAPENVPTDTPEGLNVELMNHQKCSLTWMLFRETRIPRGGILADDMGLGKTLSLIALIVAQRNARKKSEEEKKKRQEAILKTFKNEEGIIPAFSTLVVAPASVIYQWEKEIKDRVAPGKLKVYVFHGPNRETDPRFLAKNDVVITTYSIISSELGEKKVKDDDESEDSDDDGRVKLKVKQKKQISKKNKSVLTKIGWERVILDEAHNIKNRTSLMSKGCCRIPAFARWALTGTPIHNNLWDLYSLVKFLRVHPFGEEKMWKEFIIQSGRAGNERINALVKSLLLRRTKNQICPVTNQPLVGLKPRTFEVVEVALEGLEYNCYQQMFEASKQKVKQIIDVHKDRPEKSKKSSNIVRNPFIGGAREVNLDDKFQGMSAMLMLLLRLRQACVHMSLTRAAIDLEAFKNDGGNEDAIMDDLEKTLGNISITDDDYMMNEKGKKISVEDIFKPSYMSAKVKALCVRLDKVLEVGDKCVIVSQWTSMLDIIEAHLKSRKVNYTSITGKVLTKDRQERINSFNLKKGGAQVMLLSLTAGGVGLNLIGGNHLFLVDLHWNPALEQQACDRIYRVGQQKDVYIHKLISKDTIEQRVLELQNQKMQLAKGVLEGAAKIYSKLSINDLKHLFELDRRTPKPVSEPVPYSGPANVRHRP